MVGSLPPRVLTQLNRAWDLNWETEDVCARFEGKEDPSLTCVGDDGERPTLSELGVRFTKQGIQDAGQVNLRTL